MVRSHRLGFGCVLFLAGMIATAQGQPEPILALLRSGARPLVVGGVSEYTPFNVVGPDGQLTGMDREIVRAAANGSASSRWNSRQWRSASLASPCWTGRST